MRKITKKEKTIDFINDILSKFSQVIFASMVIGPIVSGKPDLFLEILGIISLAVLMMVGLKLLTEWSR
jgi:hypothetical protein